MEKQDFIHYINELKKSHQKWSVASNRVSDDSGTHFIYPTFGLFEIAIGILSQLMDDYERIIDYYIWELDWGKEGKDCFFIGEKDEAVSLTTPEELYYYLTSDNYNDIIEED